MSRTRSVAAAVAAALSLSAVGLALGGAPAGADGVTTVAVSCSGIPIVGTLNADVDVDAVDSVDPVTVGGAVTNTIKVPIPVADVPLDVTISEVKLTIPKPANVTVTGVTFTASSFTSQTWTQTSSAVVVTLTGSIAIGPGKPLPTVPDVKVATTIQGAPRTVQWKVPSTIVAKGNAGFLGNITATCTPSDPNLVLISTTVQAPPNQAPTATDQTVSTPYQTAKAITLSGTDPESQPLTFAVTSDPPHGTVSGTPPTITYTPDAGFSGLDSFTFTASDGSLSDTGTITVNVGAAVPVVPGAPAIAGAPTVADGQATIAWTAPSSDGGAPITAYVITPIRGGVPQASVEVPASPLSATLTGLQNGSAHTFTVAAKNSVGTGPASAASSAVTPQAYLPFASSSAAVARLYQWMLGRAPTASESALWVGRIDAKTHAVSDLIVALRGSTDHTGSVDPVVRLYAAYFLRIPDKPGTAYWIGKRRTGTTLRKISDGFANSVEFKTRYGALTNRQFVELIYQNILGRPGEASGVEFWTSELNAGKRSRGLVMIGFSESLEYKAKQQHNVASAVAWILLADKTPSVAERNQFATAHATTVPVKGAWAAFLRTPEVVSRATA